MKRVVDLLGNILLVIGVSFILLGYVNVVRTDGIGELFDMLSPFNILNWITILITLTPGIICKVIASKMN